MCITLFKHASINRATNDVILPHERSHAITLRCLKQVLIPITNPAMQGTQTQRASHLLKPPAGTVYRVCLVLAHAAST